jgi:hypothetical protein
LQEKDSSLFPLVVDLGGYAGQGIEAAINHIINRSFGPASPTGFADLQKVFGKGASIVLFLDSLDEQIELTPIEMSKLIDDILDTAKLGIKTIVAFRPEIFEGSRDQERMLSLGGDSPAVRFVHLQPFDETIVERVSDLAWLPMSTRTYALRLSRRPVWFSTIQELRQGRQKK